MFLKFYLILLICQLLSNVSITRINRKILVILCPIPARSTPMGQVTKHQTHATLDCHYVQSSHQMCRLYICLYRHHSESPQLTWSISVKTMSKSSWMSRAGRLDQFSRSPRSERSKVPHKKVLYILRIQNAC